MAARKWTPQNPLTSIGYAFRGVAVAFRSERSLLLELLACVLALVGLAVAGFSVSEILVVAVGGVLYLAAETLNTAIERTLDILQPEFDLRVKDIKDIAAGGVALTGIAAGLLLIATVVHHYAV